MEKLSQILWHERELLELLSFRLETERLILANGRTCWLVHATREIAEVLTPLRETEVLRAVAADAVAEKIGLPPNASLAVLAEGTGEPWRSILFEHRDAMVAIAREIADLSEQDQELLSAGFRAAQETLAAIGGGMTEGCTPAGTPVVESHRAPTEAGPRLGRIETAVQSAEDAKIALESDLSVLENADLADLAEATVSLQLADVTYPAALAATSRALQPSLVDFLR